MRILYLLLVVLFVVVQGVAGQSYFSSPAHACRFRRGSCFFGRCRRPYHQIGSCGGGSSCCIRRRWA
uniref:Avian beta-defensin 101-1 n=1 Tax=Coturnix japonica TaxID=93934 RepID=A0A0U5A2E7_COTJA|nr:avian beta-defensin 101a [Coturnix japonica]BAT57469.1 avian beta-defensin 101a [Coturnix japonica]BAT57480.1 avian beta-defensin 101a [Coturnix japonica]BAT57488.1 avian beta-defensin 101a [Coturnix japonica]BBP06468.1 avian beta-defensin 101-3 [Coturnix japonica]